MESLADRPETAEHLEAFVSRDECMQDTSTDKLLPRWLLSLAEKLRYPFRESLSPVSGDETPVNFGSG